jgi:hypothetical protein
MECWSQMLIVDEDTGRRVLLSRNGGGAGREENHPLPSRFQTREILTFDTTAPSRIATLPESLHDDVYIHIFGRK